MRYENFDHFLNMVAKILRDNHTNKKEVTLDKDLLFNIYQRFASKFTWDLKNNISLCDKKEALKWYTKKKEPSQEKMEEYEFLKQTEPATDIRQELKDFMFSELNGVSGCYEFSMICGEPLYVGVSSNLAKRPLSSYREKIGYMKLDVQVMVRFYITDNLADAYILESYLIASQMPRYNQTGVSSEVPTITISPIPKPTKFIKVN